MKELNGFRLFYDAISGTGVVYVGLSGTPKSHDLIYCGWVQIDFVG